MYRYYFIPFLILGLFHASCQQSPSKQDEQKSAKDIVMVDEDVLINRLTDQMHGNPQTQEEIDQNQIINYALDSLLDVHKTESGLYAWIVREGEGDHPASDEYVFVHYTGRFLDGQIFDSSYKRGKVAQFKLDQVIPGWREAMQMLKPGGKGIFLVPSDLAYGEKGYPPLIPPNKVLRFDIELFDTYKPE